MAISRSFVMIKPDAVQRGFIGDILSRFEHKGFKIVGLRMLQITKEMAENHYSHHKDKPFFKDLVDFMTSVPVVAFVVEGHNAVELVRKMVGATNPEEALPGTIRHDFGLQVGRNIIHASDSEETAEKEIEMFFDIDSLYDWKKDDEKWVHE